MERTWVLLGLFFSLFFTCQCISLYSQQNGFKYFAGYTPADYGLQPQNWSILQDKRGIIYIGNQGGLAEYDGVSWRKIEISNRTVRSLTIDDKDIIYVGGKNEIGYLKSDSKGALKYISLLDHIDEKQKKFGNVWKVHYMEEIVYFRTSGYLFGWQPDTGKMKVWCAPDKEKKFVSSFVCEGKFFVFQRRVGLMQVIKGSLRLVPGSEAFERKWINMVVPYDENRILVGTYKDGFYLYDGSIFVPFTTGVDEYVKENRLYHGIALSLSPGNFALATQRGGLAIIDSGGRLKHILNKDHGLPDNDVNYLFEDSGGSVWAAFDNGAARLEYHSPISIYDNRNHLPGLALAVVRHGPQNHLLAGTNQGLYLLHADGKFRLFHGIHSKCWALMEAGQSLLAATSDGVFQVNNNSKRRVINNPSLVLQRSQKDSNRIWVGARQGLISIYRDSKGKDKNGQWEKEFQFEHITDEIRTIVEDQKGNLWLGTLTNGVLELEFPGDLYYPRVSRYHTAHGLPAGEANIFKAAGHVMVGTDAGLFRFDKENNRFVPDFTLGKEFADGSRSIFRLLEDRDGNIWFHSKKRNFAAVPRSDGSSTVYWQPFLRIPKVQVNAIYPAPSGQAVWFACHNGLLRYDTRVKKDYRQSFRALIRRVSVNGSVIFEGSGLREANYSKSKPFFPFIDYKDRNLRIEYAAPFFEDETRTGYSYFLEGYDDDWSTWTRETKKDYTNLDAGSYTFRVRAKNVYENISQEDVFQFRVLPPWHQTWWAYLIYAILASSGVYFIVRWRSYRLVKEKQRLERIVNDRTKEIKEKSRQLHEQSEKLKEMDKIKSRFFANISHEFRTPLTLIMGPLEQLLSDKPGKKQEENINIALQNSQRLLTLINQLLELSKLDSGKMQLQAARQNVVPFLKGLVGSFQSLAVQKKLEITFHTEQENITLYYDAEKLEKVIGNLVSNAVKFTPARGKITVMAASRPAKQAHYPGGCVEIRVCDTGVGIPPDQLPYIFDRFYQAEGVFSHQHKQKGSGIGLALVRELVELHHGEIDVQSTEGKRTEFTLCLPLGADHLKPGEITDAAVSPLAAREPFKIPGPDTAEAVSEQEIESKWEDEPGTGGEDMQENVILVVEDNPDVRKFIRVSLESHYRVVEAADGSEGIIKARKIIPDLIVSDIMMPEADGYELCGVLKKDIKTSHIPIILLTAKASEESIIEGLETGADDYITKPFNSKILLTRIRNLIDLRRGLQEKIQREMILRPSKIAVSSIDREFMEELKKAIEKNMSEPSFGVDELAMALYMARSTLNRKIRALTGESVNLFIRSFRLKRAAQLLKANFGNVTEVAFAVGFSSSAYFTKCFKEKFHQLPHTFQASESGDR